LKLVRAKKHLGQHFLTDESVAANTVEALQMTDQYSKVIEVGPGMGVLTKYLVKREDLETYIIDIDGESIQFLLKHFGELDDSRIIEGDFLKYDLSQIFGEEKFAIVGNFPYNISSQILFKAYDNRDKVIEVVGMFQKEVAERIAAPPGSKTYGILSVLLQAYYTIDYLFTVNEDVFDPPPKVKSAVIRLQRNDVKSLDVDEKRFKSIVKIAFGQRRKTLRNSLKQFINEKPEIKDNPIFNDRPEQLSVAQFIEIVKMLD
jgi:16S rRNA (adenine1518-N6/adenine1519-N6)-dimethyltransferase